MKTPPFLLGAALIFWGWQSGLATAGAVMAIILESARVVKVRWDLGEVDFRRIWNFCTLLAFTMVIYAFTSNEEGGSFGGLFHGITGLHNATVTTARTATAFLRWLPFVFFLVVAAQIFSVRETMPLTAISLFLRRHRKREIKSGRPAPPVREVNITYPYFIVCIFSAGIHPYDFHGSESFFWGESILFAWALWPFRSRRFRPVTWTLAFAVVIAFAFYTQFGIRQLQQALEGYNATWMARFFRERVDPTQTMTSMGDIGELKLSGKIVIRMHTKNGDAPPSYLREASYRGYNSAQREWFAGTKPSDFNNVSSQTNQTTWMLLPGKINSSSVNIACYLNGRSPESGSAEGLLPLPVGSGRLENLYAYILRENPEGAVLADGPGLVIFDALYGPGSTSDSPPETNLDLLVPTNEVPALDRVISENKLTGRSEQQTLQNVYGFFNRNFTYSLWQGRDKLSRSNETILTRFLLYSRSGHCEYFASATVLLLRELGIPARYAVGYLVHERSGSGYVVRLRDAHSWCLVWNEKNKTWEDFDITPASWINIEEQRASPWQSLSDFFSWITFEISKFRWGQSNIRQYILLALIPVLIFLLYQIIFRHGRRQRKSRQSKIAETFFWPGLDSEFYQLEKKLVQRGVPRQPEEPLTDWLSRALKDETLADLRAPLNDLLELHYRHRFDPRGLDAAQRERLAGEAKACLARLG